MDSHNKKVLYLVMVLTIMVLIVGISSLVKNKTHSFSDAYIFRQEFMSYNDKIDEFASEYLDVVISLDNTVNYIDINEAIDLLTNKSGVILFGSATNENCRYIINPLLEVAKEKNEPIYYLDLKDLTSVYKIEDNNIIKEKDGDASYSQLLNILDAYLDELELYASDGTIYKTAEKKIDIPTVVAFNNGKVTSFYKEGNPSVSESNLKTIFETLIRSKNDQECARNGC